MVLDRTLRDGHCPLAERRKQRIPLLRSPVILTSPGKAAQASGPLGDDHFDCLLEGLAKLAFEPISVSPRPAGRGTRPIFHGGCIVSCELGRREAAPGGLADQLRAHGPRRYGRRLCSLRSSGHLSGRSLGGVPRAGPSCRPPHLGSFTRKWCVSRVQPGHSGRVNCQVAQRPFPAPWMCRPDSRSPACSHGSPACRGCA
jgi:hypothetical protein